MGKKTIVLLLAVSLQGWGHDISPQERPPFEQTIVTKFRNTLVTLSR